MEGASPYKEFVAANLQLYTEKDEQSCQKAQQQFLRTIVRYTVINLQVRQRRTRQLLFDCHNSKLDPKLISLALFA